MCYHLTNTYSPKKDEPSTGTQNAKNKVSLEYPLSLRKEGNAWKYESSEPPGLISRSTELEDFYTIDRALDMFWGWKMNRISHHLSPTMCQGI